MNLSTIATQSLTHVHSFCTPIFALSISTFYFMVSWLAFMPFCSASSTSLFSSAVDFKMFYYCFSNFSIVKRIYAAISCIFCFYSILSTTLGRLSRVTFTGLAYLNSLVISSLLWPISFSLFWSLSLLSSLLLWCNSSTSALMVAALLWK